MVEWQHRELEPGEFLNFLSAYFLMDDIAATDGETMK